MGVLSSLFSLDHWTLSIVTVIGVLHFTIRIADKNLRQLPLPPGPKPWPIVGNISDFPTTHEGRFWAKHKELYGPISSVKAMGTTFIILNDMDAAFELLEKRSAIYSSRYVTTFGGKMVQIGNMTALLPYGQELKLHRKLLQMYVNTVASMRWIETVEKLEARRLLVNILNEPSNFTQHLRTYSAAIILKISYGYNIDREGVDPLVKLAEEVIDEISNPANMSGTWTVDILPFLQYLPGWLPGMGFKRTAQVWRRTFSGFCEKPYAFVKQQIEKGKDESSFTSYNIEKGLADSGPGEETLKYASAQLFGAGADTTVSFLTTFFLAMTLYPDVLLKAQDEVDRVIGRDRLPDFSDRHNLPYITALIKELFRWEQVAPTAIPHLCTREDTYAGYRIPEGAVVIANTWQMSRDPDVYANPSRVIPERYLGEKPDPDPSLIAFGFGRRVCPGKRMADSSLFISIAMLVASFNITKAQDENGRDIEPDYLYKPGIVTHPTPFKCSITPRSERAAEIIRSVLDEHPFEKGDGSIIESLR